METITLTGTIRDFQDTHPDFEKETGSDPGIVKPTLGVDQKPVYAGQQGNPTTHGQASFDQWFRDVPGVNQSQSFDLSLTDPDGDGIFTYSNPSFFPIDDQLLGNQGRPHNYHFTYELHSQFKYKGGEIFNFFGDDDLFVFIDGKQVIDLGGVHQAQGASVNLDTLGLTVGQTYSFDLFFAERHTSESAFQIETSIDLEQPTPPPPECQTITGTDCDDTLTGGAGSNKILGLAGSDKLIGNAANDTLDGSAGNDALLGLAGSDLLIGGSGNDILVGGTVAASAAEVDLLSGGSGNDKFYLGTSKGVFYRNGNGTKGTDSYALIQDFEVSLDKLALYGPTRGVRNQYQTRLVDGFGAAGIKDLEVLCGSDRIAIIQDVSSLSSRNITWLS